MTKMTNLEMFLIKISNQLEDLRQLLGNAEEDAATILKEVNQIELTPIKQERNKSKGDE